MDRTIADLRRFNEFLDSTIDPKKLDEKFITSRQVELEDISKNADGKHVPLIALSYAKLLELTVLLAGRYSDNGQIVDFGDIVVNPRHIDVCILNARLIKEDYGIRDNFPLWFKRQVRECTGSRYSEDLGRMVVDPALLSHFVEKGVLLRTVKKERHGKLSEQFRYCISDCSQAGFSTYTGQAAPIAHNAVKVLGCGCGRFECRDVASWLANNTVLNIVKGALKTELMDKLHGFMSTDYLKSINNKFEKAFSALHYVSIGRKNFVNFPYNDEVNISDWDEINNTLCHFNLDGYCVIQSELDRSLSSPYYRSPFLDMSLYGVPMSQNANRTQMIRNSM